MEYELISASDWSWILIKEEVQVDFWVLCKQVCKMQCQDCLLECVSREAQECSAESQIQQFYPLLSANFHYFHE